MQYALKYLAVHRHTRLVTINIGANDVFLCQETTADHCASAAEVHAALQEIQANLTTIYTKIRDVARHHGLLVVLTYYSLNYSDPAQVAGAEALNSAIASVTEKFGGKVADGFAAFEGLSAAFGGSPCAAGLLTFFARPSPTCSSHGATLAGPIAPTENEARRCELGRGRNSFGAQITAGRGCGRKRRNAPRPAQLTSGISWH